METLDIFSVRDLRTRAGDLLGSLGLAAVDYPAEELADELAAAL